MGVSRRMFNQFLLLLGGGAAAVGGVSVSVRAEEVAPEVPEDWVAGEFCSLSRRGDLGPAVVDVGERVECYPAWGFGRRTKVWGLVRGHFGIYETDPADCQGWYVIHLPTGGAVTHFRSALSAKRMVEELLAIEFDWSLGDFGNPEPLLAQEGVGPAVQEIEERIRRDEEERGEGAWWDCDDEPYLDPPF